jgi:negative regulator of flagellin synthesis FlgM
MKIELNGPALDRVTTTETNQSQATNTGAASSAEEVGEDTATLSADTSSVSSLTQQALSAPSIRQDKVDALRQAIQSGQYQLEPDQIAQAMIDQYQQ